MNALRNKVRGINDILKIVSMTMPAEIKANSIVISGNSLTMNIVIYGSDPDIQMHTLKIFNDNLLASNRFTVTDFESIKSTLLSKVNGIAVSVGIESKSIKDKKVSLTLKYTVK